MVKAQHYGKQNCRVAGGTAGRSDRKGSAGMYKKIMTVIGWAIVALMSMALGLGMVIAVANSTPMM